MGLLVWLPLNGNLNNYGSQKNISVTNNGTTIDNNGKIGQCYSFNGSSNCITVQNAIPKLAFSISCWVYFNNLSSNMTIATCRKVVGEGIAIFQLNSGQIRFDVGSTGDTATSVILSANTWCHICCTYNGNLKNIYLNGVLIQSLTKSKSSIENLSTQGWSIGASQKESDVLSGSNNWLNGKINDFRLYDYALSEFQVKYVYNFYNPKKYIYKFNTIADSQTFITDDINYPYDKLGNAGKLMVGGQYLNDSNPGKLYFGGNNIKFIEYIETHGVQAFPNCLQSNLMIPNDNNWKFECVMMIINIGNTSYSRWFATYDGESANSYRIIKSGNTGNLLVYANTKSGGGGNAVNNTINKKYKYTLEYKKLTAYDYSANTTITTTLGTSSGTSILTRMYVGTSNSNQSARYYMFNTYHNGKLMGAMRPIKDDQGNYGFFDLLNGVVLYVTSIVDENNYTIGSE